MSKILRIYFRVVDVTLAVALVCVMTCSLREEANHEWLGIATLVLMAGHCWLNRGGLLRPFTHLIQGKLPTVRVALQFILDVALIACLIFMAWSSAVISQHALWWMPQLPGAADARAMHMSLCYWFFVLSFVHAGLHIRKKLHPALCLAVAAGGIWAAWQLNVLPYLLQQLDYPIVDLTTPIALVAVEYTLVAALAMLIGALLRRAGKIADAAILAAKLASGAPTA